MMATTLTGHAIYILATRREHPGPPPIAVRVCTLAAECFRQNHVPAAPLYVTPMLPPHLIDPLGDGIPQDTRQDRKPALSSLTVANVNPPPNDVHVLHT